MERCERGDHSDHPLRLHADERTRTSTELLPQRPERCASTSSATSATAMAHTTNRSPGVSRQKALSTKQNISDIKKYLRVLLTAYCLLLTAFSAPALPESHVTRRSRTRNVHRKSNPAPRRRSIDRSG